MTTPTQARREEAALRRELAEELERDSRLTVQQVATIFGRHPRWIRTLIHGEDLQAQKIGKTWYIDPVHALAVLHTRARGRGGPGTPRPSRRKTAATENHGHPVAPQQQAD